MKVFAKLSFLNTQMSVGVYIFSSLIIYFLEQLNHMKRMPSTAIQVLSVCLAECSI